VFERAGNFKKGSITGFFTVLVEGDDFNEPICDAVRGILDGHIILSRQLASAGYYPAIDVLQSISRVSQQISSERLLESAKVVREALASYERSEDLIHLGAYVSGSNPKLDASIRCRDQAMSFLRQDSRLKMSLPETIAAIEALAGQLA
jgi:flagellar biosynthesis/type III secretory pathway ATPase